MGRAQSEMKETGETKSEHSLPHSWDSPVLQGREAIVVTGLYRRGCEGKDTYDEQKEKIKGRRGS